MSYETWTKAIFYESKIKGFTDLGLTKSEAKEIIKLAYDNASAMNVEPLDIINSLWYVIKVFRPKFKIGDWMDIFR